GADDARCDLTADPLGALRRLSRGDDGDRRDELLAAVTGDEVVRAGRLAKRAGDLAEHRVANSMPESVVDTFEMIDVQQQHGAAQPGLECLGTQWADLVLEIRSVVQARQCIAHGALEELAVALLSPRGGPHELEDALRADADAVAAVEEAGDIGLEPP